MNTSLEGGRSNWGSHVVKSSIERSSSKRKRGKERESGKRKTKSTHAFTPVLSLQNGSSKTHKKRPMEVSKRLGYCPEGRGCHHASHVVRRRWDFVGISSSGLPGLEMGHCATTSYQDQDMPASAVFVGLPGVLAVRARRGGRGLRHRDSKITPPNLSPPGFRIT